MQIMNDNIRKLNRMLGYVAIVTFGFSLWCFWFSVHLYKNWHEATNVTEITLQMYQGEIALVKLLAFQLVPVFGAYLLFLGVMMAIYLKKRSMYEAASLPVRP